MRDRFETTSILAFFTRPDRPRSVFIARTTRSSGIDLGSLSLGLAYRWYPPDPGGGPVQVLASRMCYADSLVKLLRFFRPPSPLLYREGLYSHTSYGRGAGVGRGLGVGADLGVGVGFGVAVAVSVGVAVAVAVAVTVAVGLGVDVGVGVGSCTSNDPMSIRPFTTRSKAAPR